MVKVINLTPHTVNIVDEDGIIVRTYPSEGVARATQRAKVIGELDGIELVSMHFDEPVDLPAPSTLRGCSYSTPCTSPNGFDCQGCDGAYSGEVYFIVSITTAQAAKATGRTTDDLLITANTVRDSDGRIIGCRQFARI